VVTFKKICYLKPATWISNDKLLSTNFQQISESTISKEYWNLHFEKNLSRLRKRNTKLDAWWLICFQFSDACLSTPLSRMETYQPFPSLNTRNQNGFGSFLGINPCQTASLPKMAEKPKAELWCLWRLIPLSTSMVKSILSNNLTSQPQDKVRNI